MHKRIKTKCLSLGNILLGLLLFSSHVSAQQEVPPQLNRIIEAADISQQNIAASRSENDTSLYSLKTKNIEQRHFGFNAFGVPSKVTEVRHLDERGVLEHIEDDIIPAFLDLSADMGRIHPDSFGSFSFDHIDPDKDGRNLDFSFQDQYVRLAQSYGLQILPSFSPHSDWINNPHYVPSNLTAYKEYIRRTVERYDGDGLDDMPDLKEPIKYWQLDNEADLRNNYRPHQSYPNFETPQDYLTVLKLTYEALKEADPESKLMPNLAGLGQDMGERSLSYLKELIQQGATKYFDVYSYHVYTKTYNMNVLKDFLKKIRNLLPDQPFWITETSVTSSQVRHFQDEASQYHQAIWLLKNHVYHFAHGAEKIFWLSPRNTSPALPEGLFTDSGLMSFWGEPKFSYYVYQHMTDQLEDFTDVDIIEEDIYKFGFENKSPVFVLWSEKKRIVDLSKYVSTPKVIISYFLDDETAEPFHDIHLTKELMINPIPIFLKEYQEGE